MVKFKPFILPLLGIVSIGVPVITGIIDVVRAHSAFELARGLNFLEQFTLLLSIALLYAACLYDAVTAKRIYAAGIIAFLLHSNNVDLNLHQWLLSHDLYPSFMRTNHGTNPPNPQTIRLLVFAAGLFWLAIRLFTKRTFDRVYVFLINTLIIGILVIYHSVIVYGWINEYSHDRSLSIQAALKAPAMQDFERLCEEMQLDCQQADISQPFKLRYKSNHFMEGEIERLRRNVNSKQYLFVHNSFNGLTDPDVRYFMFAFYRNGHEYRAVIDRHHYTDTLDRYQSYFYMLNLIGQFIWLCGGLSLLSFHKRRLGIESNNEKHYNK